MGLLMGMEPPGLWARLEIRTLTCSPRGTLWEQGCEAGPPSAGSPASEQDRVFLCSRRRDGGGSDGWAPAAASVGLQGSGAGLRSPLPHQA